MEKVGLMDDDMGAVMSRCSRIIEVSSCIRVADEAVAYIRKRAEAAESKAAEPPSGADGPEQVSGDRDSLSLAAPSNRAEPGSLTTVIRPVVKAAQPPSVHEWIASRFGDRDQAPASDFRNPPCTEGELKAAKRELGISSFKVGARWYWEHRK